MPISKSNAEAAVAALKNLKAGVFFQTVQDNPHSFSKHFTKAKAKQAAGGGRPQGYFKKASVVQVTSKEVFNHLSETKQQSALQTIGAKKSNIPMKLGQYNKKHEETGGLQFTNTSATDVSGILDIVQGVLGNCQLRESNDDPDTRFLAVAPVPKGFVGRAIDEHGTKSYDCDYAVVVVNGSSVQNAQVVTVFPANAQFVNNRPLLV